MTAPFTSDASAQTVTNALNALTTVGNVLVTYSSGTTFCDDSNLAWASWGVGPVVPIIPAGRNMVSVTFLSDHGPQPSLVVLDATGALLTGTLDNGMWTAYGGASLPVGMIGGGVSTATSVVGTKENAVCSNRGSCSTLTGLCTCSSGFYPSDGQGNAGTINDCGYVPLNAVSPFAPSPVITACPGTPLVCSAHGTCDR